MISAAMQHAQRIVSGTYHVILEGREQSNGGRDDRAVRRVNGRALVGRARTSTSEKEQERRTQRLGHIL